MNCLLHVPIVPSDYPQDFVGIASTSRSANFTWDPPPVDHQNGIISEYFINITDAVSGDTLHLSTSETSLSIDFLQPFTIYFCVISSATSVGVGPHSTVFTLETPEDGKLRNLLHSVIIITFMFINSSFKATHKFERCGTCFNDHSPILECSRWRLSQRHHS